MRQNRFPPMSSLIYSASVLNRGLSEASVGLCRYAHLRPPHGATELPELARSHPPSRPSLVARAPSIRRTLAHRLGLKFARGARRRARSSTARPEVRFTLMRASERERERCERSGGRSSSRHVSANASARRFEPPVLARTASPEARSRSCDRAVHRTRRSAGSQSSKSTRARRSTATPS